MSKKLSMRLIRKQRVRKRISVSPGRPRLSVFRSRKHTYAQIIDDQTDRTLVSASTLSKEIKEKALKAKKTDASAMVGELLARLALEKDIKSVVFDRGGYLYHGRVKALAEGARKGGLQF